MATNHEPDSERYLFEECFAQVPYSLVNDVKDKKLNATDVLIYIVFAHHQRKKESSYASNQTVAEYVGKDKKTVERSIKKLEAAGHLARLGRTRYGTKYTYLKTKVVGGKTVRGEPVEPFFIEPAENKETNRLDTLIKEVFDKTGHIPDAMPPAEPQNNDSSSGDLDKYIEENGETKLINDMGWSIEPNLENGKNENGEEYIPF